MSHMTNKTDLKAFEINVRRKKYYEHDIRSPTIAKQDGSIIPTLRDRLFPYIFVKSKTP